MGKTPTPTDAHVGKRIRIRRLMVGMSQKRLAEEIGVSFQQLQKYENGSNRISASRLQQMSRILGVLVAYFFEDVADCPGRSKRTANLLSDFYTVMKTPDGIALVTAFQKIKDGELRRYIVHLVQGIANHVE